MRIIVVIALTFMMMNGCNEMKDTDEKLKSEILAMETKALEIWNTGNPDGYLDIYSQDISYFDPFLEKRLNGFAEIKSAYENIRGTFHVDKYEIIDPVVEVSGTMAVLSFNLNSQSGDSIYKWNCTEIYRKECDGKWRIIHTHWSLVKPI